MAFQEAAAVFHDPSAPLEERQCQQKHYLLLCLLQPELHADDFLPVRPSPISVQPLPRH